MHLSSSDIRFSSSTNVRVSFASNVTDATNPNWSDSAPSIEKIPLREQDFSFTATPRAKQSLSTSHVIPSAWWIVLSFQNNDALLVPSKVLRRFPKLCHGLSTTDRDATLLVSTIASLTLSLLQPNVPLSKNHPWRNSFSLSRQPSRQIRLNCLRLFEVAQNLHKSETTWFRKDSCNILPVWGTHLHLATRGTRGNRWSEIGVKIWWNV